MIDVLWYMISPKNQISFKTVDVLLRQRDSVYPGTASVDETSSAVARRIPLLRGKRAVNLSWLLSSPPFYQQKR
jgi:hypothetical protein